MTDSQQRTMSHVLARPRPAGWADMTLVYGVPLSAMNEEQLRALLHDRIAQSYADAERHRQDLEMLS